VNPACSRHLQGTAGVNPACNYHLLRGSPE